MASYCWETVGDSVPASGLRKVSFFLSLVVSATLWYLTDCSSLRVSVFPEAEEAKGEMNSRSRR